MQAVTPPLRLHPDRLLPAEPGVRAIARELYGEVAGLPIVSPHGHTDPAWFATDAPFGDATSLLLAPDHYLHRMLRSQGVDIARLGVADTRGRITADPREAWRLFAAHQSLFRGTPSALWLDHVFAQVFGFEVRLRLEDRRPLLRPDRRGPGDRRLSPPRPVRALRHRGADHHRRSRRRPCAPPRDPRLGLAGPGHHRLSTGRGDRCGGRALRPGHVALRRAQRLRRMELARLPGGASPPPGGLHRARRHVHRPRPPDRRHCRSPLRRGGGAVRARDGGRRLVGGRRAVPRADADGDGPDVGGRRPGDAAAPRQLPQPRPRAVRRLRAGQGRGHPPRAPTMSARCGRC